MSTLPYQLFIDDERWPSQPNQFMVRSSREAQLAVQYYGVPQSIAFDHDLGGDDTAIIFINWFENQVVDGNLILPPDFSYTVHSANPIGADNIRSRMDQLIYHYGTE